MAHVLSPIDASQPDFSNLSLDLSSLLNDNDLCLGAPSSILPSPLLSPSPTLADSVFNPPIMPLFEPFKPLASTQSASQSVSTNTSTSWNAPSESSTNASSKSLHLLSPVTDRSSSPLPQPPPPPPLPSSPSCSKSKRVSSASPKSAKPCSAVDKIAERRRKNRESSSRCYYNRKRIIQSLEKQLWSEKQKLTNLYDTALQLRHENSRLKKEVVTNGYDLPCSRSTRSYNSSRAFSLREYLRLLHHSTYNNAAQM